MPARKRSFELQMPILEEVKKDVARYLLASIARAVLCALKQNRLSIEKAEDLVFNLDTLIFCQDVLKDKDLSWAIDYGMELASIHEHVQAEGALPKAYSEIDRKLSSIALSHHIRPKQPRKRSSSQGVRSRKALCLSAGR